MKAATSASFWSRVFLIVGGASMLVGALDPLEGSLLIAPGAMAWAAGTWLGAPEIRRHLGIRLVAMVLVLAGVGALWGFSQVGGFGGNTGRSMWWAMLVVVPYFGGWLLELWGPGSPRWLQIGSLGVGAWYIALALMMANKPRAMPEALYFIGALGAAVIAGSAFRLWKSTRHPISA